MAEDRASTKLIISHPDEPNCSIVGILEQLTPRQSTQGRKIALILHGTMGHKDYLFQRRLAVKLPLDSFRFDFRGNHESGGTWKQGALQEDLVDLELVVGYLKEKYGYVIELVVGHSRGSLVAMRWLCTTEDGNKVPAFVNASGRYRMALIMESPGARVWTESFKKQGYHIWNVVVARKQITAKIRPEDLQSFISWDSSVVWDKFPQATDVLTLHGLSDKTVSPYDAVIYARAFGNRSPGTHTLNLMENADHNFTGRQDEVVDNILDWWQQRERRELKTGVWQTGIRGKL